MTINGIAYTPIGDVVINKSIAGKLDSSMFYVRGDQTGTILKYQICSGKVNGVPIGVGISNSDDSRGEFVWEVKYFSESNKSLITTVEYTKILEELVIDGFGMTSFSSPDAGYTHLIYKLNKRILYTGYSLAINQSIGGTGETREVVLDGTHTLREIIDYYLESYSKEVRVSYLSNKELELYLDDPSARGSAIAYNVPYENSVDGSNQVSNLATDLKNVVSELPVDDGPLQIVSDANNFSTDNGIVKTNQPIYRMKECYFSTPLTMNLIAGDFKLTVPISGTDYSVGVYISDTDLSSTKDTTSHTGEIYVKTDGMLDVPFTDCVLDFDAYQTMSHDEKCRLAYYKRGSQEVEHITTSVAYTGQVLGTRPVYENILDYLYTIRTDSSFILKTFLALSNHDEGLIYSKLSALGWTPDYTRFPTYGFGFVQFVFPIAYPDEFWKMMFVHPVYYTKTDTFIKTGTNGTSVIDGQTANSVNEERFKASETSKLARMGNRELAIDRNGNTFFSVGDTYGNFVVDEATYSATANNIKQHYHLTENYNFLNLRQDLNRELRLYAIPTEGFAKSYFEQALTSDLDSFTGAIIKAYVPQLNSSTTYVERYIWIPITHVLGRAIIHFQDNFSALKYRYKSYQSGNVYNFTSLDCAYCDPETGELSTMVIYLVKTRPKNYGTNGTYNDGYPVVNLSDFNQKWVYSLEYPKSSLEQLEIVMYTASNGKALSESANYTITQTLSHCSSSNTSTSIGYGADYFATLTPDSGYRFNSLLVDAKMGENECQQVTVTSSSVIIYQQNVTDNITVEATAVTEV